MSRWFPTAALLAALLLSSLAGCGPSGTPTSGKGGQSSATGSTPADKPAESGKDTSKGTTDHHDPR